MLAEWVSTLLPAKLRRGLSLLCTGKNPEPETQARLLAQQLEQLRSDMRLDVISTGLGQIPRQERLMLARSLLLQDMGTDNADHIPSAMLREHPVANSWTHQNENMHWDFPPGARVLDVGSGGWPFRHATHLVDRHPGDTTHRHEPLVRDHRPLIAADLHQLPFANQSFDFIFCSHVLEHMKEPGNAMREMQRVGRRGYIETPTRLSDVLLNFTGLPDHHRWHTLLLGRTLLLIEWRDEERRSMGTNAFFNLLHSLYHNPVQDLFEANRDMFAVQLFWEKTLDFLVLDQRGAILDQSEGYHLTGR